MQLPEGGEYVYALHSRRGGPDDASKISPREIATVDSDDNLHSAPDLVIRCNRLPTIVYRSGDSIPLTAFGSDSLAVEKIFA